MGHRITLLLQLLLLAVLKIGLAEFIILELQEVQVLTVPLDIILECLQLLAYSMVLPEGLLILGQFLGIVGDDIHDA